MRSTSGSNTGELTGIYVALQTAQAHAEPGDCELGVLMEIRTLGSFRRLVFVNGLRHGMDPRIQDVVLLLANFTTNPYDPLFLSGKLG